MNLGVFEVAARHQKGSRVRSGYVKGVLLGARSCIGYYRQSVGFSICLEGSWLPVQVAAPFVGDSRYTLASKR